MARPRALALLLAFTMAAAPAFSQAPAGTQTPAQPAGTQAPAPRATGADSLRVQLAARNDSIRMERAARVDSMRAEREARQSAAAVYVGGPVLVFCTLLLVVLFLWEAMRERPLSVESHWGGLGGGLGGWRISPALIYMLGAIAFGVMLSAVVIRMFPTTAGGGGPPAAAADSARARRS